MGIVEWDEDRAAPAGTVVSGGLSGGTDADEACVDHDGHCVAGVGARDGCPAIPDRRRDFCGDFDIIGIASGDEIAPACASDQCAVRVTADAAMGVAGDLSLW